MDTPSRGLMGLSKLGIVYKVAATSKMTSADSWINQYILYHKKGGVEQTPRTFNQDTVQKYMTFNDPDQCSVVSLQKKHYDAIKEYKKFVADNEKDLTELARLKAKYE